MGMMKPQHHIEITLPSFLSTHATTIVAEVLEVLETQVPGYLSAAFRPQFCYPPCISTT
jgi:hypothetical protein